MGPLSLHRDWLVLGSMRMRSIESTNSWGGILLGAFEPTKCILVWFDHLNDPHDRGVRACLWQDAISRQLVSVWSVTHTTVQTRADPTGKVKKLYFCTLGGFWTMRTWANESILSHAHAGIILEYCTKTRLVTSEETHHYDCQHSVTSSLLNNVAASKWEAETGRGRQIDYVCKAQGTYGMAVFDGKIYA